MCLLPRALLLLSVPRDELSFVSDRARCSRYTQARVYTSLVRLGQQVFLPFLSTPLCRYPWETIERATVPWLIPSIRSQRTSAEKRSNLDACDTTS